MWKILYAVFGCEYVYFEDSDFSDRNGVKRIKTNPAGDLYINYGFIARELKIKDCTKVEGGLVKQGGIYDATYTLTPLTKKVIDYCNHTEGVI